VVVVVAAIAFGIAIGMAIGALGGGGSVIAVPILVYVLGLDVHEATTTSLIVVTAGAVAGGLGHARDGNVCWRHAGAFAVAALPGVAAGTVLGDAVGGNTLLVAFAFVMLAAAAATWLKVGADDGQDGAGDGLDGADPVCPPVRVGRNLAAGFAVGLLTGFFGVGGGFLVVPTLAIALALSMRLAVGTSLAIITATSVMGLVAHLLAGRDLDLDVTAAMTVACVIGAVAGSTLAIRLPERRLGRGFASLVSVLAIYLLISAAFFGGPPAP
jgi:uncharacterized membrane protein YfcA